MKKFFCGFYLFFLWGLFFTPMVMAQEAVEMIPMRIIMEGRDRSETLSLINRNSVPVTYRMETLIIRQKVSGGKERVKEPTPEEQRILDMVRFSPRKVRIEPNTIQTVRIMTRKPANLPAGEYRVHIQATPVPEKKDSPPQENGIFLDIVVSTSIPLIIRHGETHVALKAEGLVFETRPNGKKVLKTRIIADGNRSAYINAALYHGNTLLGEAKGFAVYQPNGQRDVFFPLQGNLPPSGSTLRLLLHDREKETLPFLKEIPLVLSY